MTLFTLLDMLFVFLDLSITCVTQTVVISGIGLRKVIYYRWLECGVGRVGGVTRRAAGGVSMALALVWLPKSSISMLGIGQCWELGSV